MRPEGKPVRVLAAEAVDPGSLRVARAVLGLVGLLTAGRMVWYGWIELIDATTYLNHYWAMTLVAVLLALARPTRGWIWLLRFQVGLVYVFAGLAKLQADWLVHALPLRLWLPARADLPLIGHVLTWSSTAHVLSIAGAAFDCAVVPLLLWRRTRLAAWCALLAFHVATWTLFPIGVFPWLMTGLATLFFAPDWPTRLRRLRPTRVRNPFRNLGASVTALGDGGPQVGGGLGGDPGNRGVLVTGSGDGGPQVGEGWGRSVGWPALCVAVLWVGVQLFLPLRAHLYPGDSRWTTEGYQFAWNVLLTERAGTVTFNVTDPATGDHTTYDARRLYTATQLRVMTQDPDLIHQAAKAIAAAEGGGVEVRVDAWLSLNGRPAARYIDPTVDLAAEPRTPWHRRWVLAEP
jgi:hypothetical protein